MPRDNMCNHPNCEGEPCKQLTNAELTPGQEDLEYAKKLIDEGYRSISTKYRMVVKYTVPRPAGKEIIRPELLGTVHGEAFAKLWDDQYSWGMRLGGENITKLELTVRQFRAFKQLGGKMA